MNLNRMTKDERDQRQVARAETRRKPRPRLRRRAAAALSRAWAASAPADCRGSVRDSVVATPMRTSAAIADIAGAPGGLWPRPSALEAADQEQRAGGRSQHADAIGGDIGRHAGGLLAFVRLSTRKASTTMSCVAEAVGDQQRAERDHERRDRRIAQRRERRSPRSAGTATAAASRAAGRSSRDSTGTSSASISGAQRNLSV